MRYYEIRHSLDKKVVGSYPQVEEAKHNCDIWNDPKFIGNFHFEKITLTPIVSNAILKKKSKLTDLISVTVIGFSNKLLMSKKLKTILDNTSINGIQFFRSSIFQNNIEYPDYYLLNVYSFENELIDFEKTTFSLRKRKEGGGTEQLKVNIDSYEDFLQKLSYYNEKKEILKAEKVYLQKNIDVDFIVLKNPIKYVVSEKLKEEIEDSGCTGIEFMPLDMKLSDWLQGGEREKVYE